MVCLSREGMHAACVGKIRNGMRIGIFSVTAVRGNRESKAKAVFFLFLVEHAEVSKSGSRYSERSYCDSTSVPKTPLTFKGTVCSWCCICVFLERKKNLKMMH